jgi:glycogen synthase
VEKAVPKPLKILFLSPEAVPFAKTGGLADVAGAVPPALKRLGADVRLVMPFYRVVREGNFEEKILLKRLTVWLGTSVLAFNAIVLIARALLFFSESRNRIDCGVTILEAKGVCKGKEERILYTAFTLSEIQPLKELVGKIDPDALVMV